MKILAIDSSGMVASVAVTEDVKAGRTVDGEKAISDIRGKYGI